MSSRPRTSSRPSTTSRSTSTNSSVHPGDRKRRVTVPLPRSLHELQNAAVLHFGHSGELRLYHHGSVQIKDSSHLCKVKDGDVVVVTWDNRRLTSKEFADLVMTTNRLDFVEHALPRRKESKPTPPRLPQVPLDATTSYNSDYVRHPPAIREKYTRPSSWSARKEPMGKSTYAEEYPRHEVSSPRILPRRAREETPRKVTPFTGSTSYSSDYVEHPLETRGKATNTRDNLKTEHHVPFLGQSTYGAEFITKPVQARNMRRPHSVTVKSLPFEGSSHYKSSYIAHPIQQVMIHLEPELSRSSTPASDSS